MSNDISETPVGTFTTPASGETYYTPEPLPYSFTPSTTVQRLINECVAELEITHKAIQSRENQVSALDEILWAEARGSSAIEGIPPPYSTVTLDPETGRVDLPLVRTNHEMLYEAVTTITSREDISKDTAHDLHTVLNSADDRETLKEEHVGIHRAHGVYIPLGDGQTFRPVPPRDVSELMGQFYNYLATEPPAQQWLVEAAIAHHQFETIHPYLDGNGRVGRALLLAHITAESPFGTVCAAPSTMLNDRREEYYAGFQTVRKSGDWGPWCQLLIECIKDSAVHLRERVLTEID